MPETTDLMQRPTKSNPIVKQRALEMLMPKVKKYLGAGWSASEQPHIEQDLMEVMASGKNGYGMARELENYHHWEEDRELLDLMDDAESCLEDAYKEILGQWIKCYGIAPARKVGDVVSTTHWHRKGQIGKIARIYEDRAEYGVHFPDQPHTSWMLLKYEEVVDALVAV